MKADDLRKLGRKLGLRRMKERSGNLISSCPFAPWYHKGTDRRPSFGIKIDDMGESAFNCFGCGMRGDLLHLCFELGEHRGEDYSDLEEWIVNTEEVGIEGAIEHSKKSQKEIRDEKRRKIESQAYPDNEYSIYLENGPPKYAQERGLTKEAIAEWEIGDDPEQGRMTFPVRRHKDRALVGIKGRTYTGAEDKYLPYLPWNQNLYLFGEHMIRPVEHDRRVVVVEGELDAIKVWMAGFTGLAIMGRTASPAQKKTLLKLDRPVVLMPDNDRQGTEWANALGDFLNEELSVRDAYVPEGKKDPGDMTLEEIVAAVKKAKIRI